MWPVRFVLLASVGPGYPGRLGRGLLGLLAVLEVLVVLRGCGLGLVWWVAKVFVCSTGLVVAKLVESVAAMGEE